MSAVRQLDDAERVSWLQLARTERIGPVTFRKLINTYGSATQALSALPELAARGGGRLRVYGKSLAEDEISDLQRLGATLVAPGERGYPPYLRQLRDAPPILSVCGQLDLADMDAVAIVGARNASAIGRKFTRMIAERLRSAGLLVVSGLARGIDTAAHEAAGVSLTAAVVAGGIDHVYPPENSNLQKAIAQDGLLISEMPVGTVPKAEHFPRRNRIISGMSRAVIVVEAAIHSGSLITAGFAAEQGREVFAVPGHPLDPRSEGANRLIKDGAAILTSVDDVFDALAQTPRPRADEFWDPPRNQEPRPEPQDGDREHLLSFLSPSPVALDDLIRECKLDADVVSGLLLELELAGRVTRSGNGHVSLS